MTQLLPLNPVEIAIIGELYFHNKRWFNFNEKNFSKMGLRPPVFGLLSTYFLPKARRYAKRLKAKELIKVSRIGRESHYSITDRGIAEFETRAVSDWSLYERLEFWKHVTTNSDRKPV